MLRAAVSACAAVVVLLGTAGPARAAEPGWTAAPAAGAATRPGSADERPYFYLQGVPGTVLEDRLALSNPSGRTRTVTLHGADAYNGPGGAFAVRPAARTTGAGSWIRFADATVRIPPRTRAVVPFTVTVPSGAVPGDHPAAVVATEGGREAGVRVRLRVEGPTLSALTVEDVAVTGSGRSAVLRYALVNRGNTTLSPELAVRAAGLFGELPGHRARPLGVELLPGRRVELTEPWPGAPALDSVDLTLTVTAGGGAHASATGSAAFVPWAAVAGTAASLAALGTAALLFARTRRNRRAASPEPREQAVRPAPEAELTGAAR
ncbi:COG1470 family protein [Streptomyces sp. NBC_00239]|uniref:COG1470 family protein n=1 Tax=Streptomyces sp. NBC_00239 TaxID=2903640 RepID=UPI002E27E174|nr:hypothetical protein [Streptomyces sp. NBC_00239]